MQTDNKRLFKLSLNQIRKARQVMKKKLLYKLSNLYHEQKDVINLFDDFTAIPFQARYNVTKETTGNGVEKLGSKKCSNIKTSTRYSPDNILDKIR